ncbi:hypothetical protein VCCP104417_3204, partial [Vibrio cholerae CP1044(17)]
MAFPVPLNR